ncbi:MAG: hypothetical protein OXB88_10745 [Bacteriovoracales bacterium]|nr:hypothetical protein [Bacteriovoracales bacterium]
MHEKLSLYLNQAMSAISTDKKKLERLLAARKVYEKLTGKIDEDGDDYEVRILSFNEWFLIDYISEKNPVPFIIEFLNTLNDSVGEIKAWLSDVHYSFFECRKKRYGSNLILEDFLRGEKYEVLPESFPADILSSEIFVGRMIKIEKKVFFFKGIRWLPKEVKSLVRKRIKRIRELGSPFEENRFIFSLEMAVTKCAQFKHVNAVKIFSSYIT